MFRTIVFHLKVPSKPFFKMLPETNFGFKQFSILCLALLKNGFNVSSIYIEGASAFLYLGTSKSLKVFVIIPYFIKFNQFIEQLLVNVI